MSIKEGITNDAYEEDNSEYPQQQVTLTTTSFNTIKLFVRQFDME